MIKDTAKLNEIQACWNGVEILRGKIQRSLFAALGSLDGTFPFAAANAAHNLPFMHAMSVLNDVLRALAKEGRFNCGSRGLGRLLDAAKDDLQWVDYHAIREANRLRVGLAHRGELLPRADCWKHIDTVKTQLVAWSVIGAS